MNAVTKESGKALEASEQEVMNVLRHSIYPGSQDESIKMVMSYCRSRQLDPMQKPVHLVPMRVKLPGTDQYEWRDVVMPGVGLYRIQASRTGMYAGMDEPEFGEDVTETLEDVQVTYPQWCKVTVYKIVQSVRVAFTAREFWKENYATRKRDSDAPNAMWKKRPYGQLAKCAEAQALRKAFPEEIGAAPTAEEMEGKHFEYDEHDVTPAEPEGPPPYPQENFDENLPKWREIVESGKKTPDQIIRMVETKGTLTEEQKEQIRNMQPIEGEATE